MTSPEVRAVLLRHGETEWSRDGRHTGRTDIELTENGREQARRAAAAVAGFLPARVLVSPLRRALETATLAGLEPLEERDDLMEWDYGAYEGLTTVQIRANRPGWVLWDDGCPGGEDSAAVGRRADRVIAEVLASEAVTILVAHGHLLRVLGARWLSLPPDGGRLLVLGAATLSLLGCEWDTQVIRRWNDDSHLADPPR
jgi:probable phosphoglycerate mutase